MNPHPSSMMFLAGRRHRELQEEAGQMRLLRQAQASGDTPHSAMVPACRQLGATLARVRQRLELITWAPAPQRRGMIPR